MHGRFGKDIQRRTLTGHQLIESAWQSIHTIDHTNFRRSEKRNMDKYKLQAVIFSKSSVNKQTERVDVISDYVKGCRKTAVKPSRRVSLCI